MHFIVSKPCPKCGVPILIYDFKTSLLYLEYCEQCDYYNDKKYYEILPGKVQLLSQKEYDLYIKSNEKIKKFRDMINMIVNKLP